MKVLLKLSALALLVVCLVLLFGLRRRASAQGTTISLTQSFCSGTPCMWTYHNNNRRDGVNPNESTITPGYFSSHTFQAITVTGLDGLIYTQPLYIHALGDSNGNVGSNGSCTGNANVVFVATENNTVYAINASTGNICWQHTLDRTSPAETAIPWMDLPTQNGNPGTDLVPEVGVTSTPVIDVNVTPPIMYVVSAHKISSPISYDHVIHAIDTTTGNEIVSSQSISSVLPASFVALAQKQRASLALSTSNGVASVYIAWASFGDSNSAGDYNGWVAEFQLNYSAVNSGNGSFSYAGNFTSEPVGNPYKGGIWMGGAAPALDPSGNVYLSAGNGTQTGSYTSGRFDHAVLKLIPSSFSTGSPGAPGDFYMPNDFLQLNGGQSNQFVCLQSSCSNGTGDAKMPNDMDMGTGGVVLLNSATSPELVSIGKEGMLYVIAYSSSTSSTTIMGGVGRLRLRELLLMVEPI